MAIYRHMFQVVLSDIEYPWQCSITWQFLQKVIFSLEDRRKNKKTSLSVVSMRAALKAWII